MRRPDDEEDYYGTEIVHAKPIDDRINKKLGDSFKTKDFVKSRVQSQEHFHGNQNIVNTSEINNSNLRPMTHDERNKISAKIIKAELKQNKVFNFFRL